MECRIIAVLGTRTEAIKLALVIPQSLEHETWRMPASRFVEPRILQGSAQVVRDDDAWRIIAGDGRSLQFQSERLAK